MFNTTVQTAKGHGHNGASSYEIVYFQADGTYLHVLGLLKPLHALFLEYKTEEEQGAPPPPPPPPTVHLRAVEVTQANYISLETEFIRD